MKKLILAITVAAFAVAATAGDNKTCPNDSTKPACCAKAKQCGDQTKACPMGGKAAGSKTASKPLPSPKANTLASK